MTNTKHTGKKILQCAYGVRWSMERYNDCCSRAAVATIDGKAACLQHLKMHLPKIKILPGMSINILSIIAKR